MIYIYIFIVFVVFLFTEQTKGTDKIRPIMQWGAFLFLIVFIGLRYETGPDYLSYVNIFQNEEQWRGVEPFFKYTIYLFHKFKLSYYILFLLFVATLSLGIKFYILKKYSPYFFLSLIIGIPIFLGDMGQIRFSLAMATLWLSIPYCLERNLIKYIIVVIIAISMHYSAIVFLPVYWIAEKRINVYLMLGIWAVCYLCSFISGIEERFSSFATSLNINEFSQKINLYEGSDTYAGRYGISLLNILSKVLVIFSLYYFTGSEKSDRLQRMLLNIYFLGGCFFFFFSFGEVYGIRFSLYFFSFLALAVPVAIYNIKDIKLHYLFICLFILQAFYQYYTLIYVLHSTFYFPYKNVLFI